MDAKYYIHFYHKYSYYWAPESTRSTEPYRGLYVPIEKRKEEDTYHFGQPLSKYEPLRTMIYQDFHDRVQNGLPPSLDLEGKLPTLAMHYARTTFVPPMSKNELMSLFYPLNDINNRRDIVVPPYSSPRIEKVDLSGLNRFQNVYFSRKYMLGRLTSTFCLSYDSYSDTITSITGEKFLERMTKIMFAFEKKENTFPQYYHTMGIFHTSTSKSIISSDLILLMCMCFFMGVPLVIPLEKAINLEILLPKLSQYCEMPIVASSDDRLVSTILHNGKSNNIRHVMYYGNNEPHVISNEKQGSLISNDPVSNILQPFNVSLENIHWSYTIQD